MDRLPQGSVAIEGPARTGKSRLLMDRVLALLQTHSTDSVLVLCSNYYRKSQFLEQVQEHLHGGFSQIQVTTYSALVRNTLAMFWPCVEDFIAQHTRLGGQAHIFPELSGFEATEYIVKKIVNDLKQLNPEAFYEFQGAERSLLTQLLRRIRLKSENRLERQDMYRRSQLIGEPCLEETAKVLLLYDKWSYELRVLDNSKQIDVFHELLRTNEDVQRYFTQRVRHLVVDDVDETVPAQQHFVMFMAPYVETLTLAADIDGGTRRGYLNAYPYDWEGLKALKPEMETLTLSRDDAMANIGAHLLQNWLQPQRTPEERLLPTAKEIRWRPPALIRMDMLDQVVEDIVKLLQRDPGGDFSTPITPGDLVIVMPKVDLLARMQLQHQLVRRGIPLQILTGTQRPTDNPVCRSLLLLLQLINAQAWHMPLSPLELKGILHHGLKLNLLDPQGLETVIQEYRTCAGKALFTQLPPGDHLKPEAQNRYNKLLAWLREYQSEPVEEQFYAAFNDVISPQLSDTDELSDIQQLIRSLYIQRIAQTFPDAASDSKLPAREWFIQVKTGIVADTPNKPREIDPQAIVLGTPQKIIDFEIERPIHLWLDVSSREWSRTDNAPLYNAWVHSPNWDGSTTVIDDPFNQMLTRTRAAHITRTLTLYAGKRILLYSSELDEEGYPHSGIFPHMLVLPSQGVTGAIQRAALREDQAQVLTYTGGSMAITAVPGAGKTFVNVELLVELILRGIPPESILVLTYMDSAAKTLISRLKAKLSGHSGLPIVSTIHSLAFRIITEADHAHYLGLDADNIEIVDEYEARELIQPIVDRVDNGEGHFKSVEPALKAIGMAKSHRLAPQQMRTVAMQKGIQSGLWIKFTHIYQQYQETLKQQGKLDFTDLIVKAIELLENRPDVREKYQGQFQYIIEDEAQDSSLLLQSFINLLKQGHGNLIRTGDTNQSITTTFSTADTSVFRNFIAECEETGQVIQMDQSSRCAKPVIDLANRFIHWAVADEILQQAFHPVEMKPVHDRNPELIEALHASLFESQGVEHAWLVDKITSLQSDSMNRTIAVLVRNNQHVLSVTQVLQAHGIKAVCYTDTPEMNPVFLTIVAALNVLENPMDTSAMTNLLQQMQTLGLLSSFPDQLQSDAFTGLLHRHPDDIDDAALLQLYYNLHDLIRYTFGQDICRLIVRLTDMFFVEPQQRSIGYMCALRAQAWVERALQAGQLEHSPLELVNRELKTCLEKRRLPFRNVQDAAITLPDGSQPFVQVMTLHKSKGQEFDVVFIPGVTERNFPSVPASVSWRDSDKLELDIERLARQSEVLDAKMLEAEKKRKKVEEEARLVYVGLTRARQGLYLSCPLESKDWRGRPEIQRPSRYFEFLKHVIDSSDRQPSHGESISHAR